MSERRTIGQILSDIGRISEDEIAAALDYQRDHGGYFGEALIACGFVTEGELEWGLASQFELPYIFPESESVDLAVAALVTPEWAMEHLTLPLARTDDGLQVVIDSPMKQEPVDFLTDQTGLDVQLSLAAPGAIKQLIREVYARASALEELPEEPVDLAGLLKAAVEGGASRFGISVRGTRSSAWWIREGAVRRASLEGDWRAGLDEVLQPGATLSIGDQGRASWSGVLRNAGVTIPVSVDFLGDESGREFLFTRTSGLGSVRDRFPGPSDGVVSEIRQLARQGRARFLVMSEPAGLGHEVLPHLPTLVLDPDWRSIYLATKDRGAPSEAFSLTLADDSDSWVVEMDALSAFHFDVVVVDLAAGDGAWLSAALDVAAVSFVLWPSDGDLDAAIQAGVGTTLHINRGDNGHLEWSLESVVDGRG